MELLQGKHTQKFWVSARGAAYGYDTLNRHLAQLTHRVFGEAFRPHAFREIAATSIALANPEWAGIIPDLLGHASETYGEKIYNRATGIVAVTTHQGLIAQLRRAAKQATKINKPTGSDWP